MILNKRNWLIISMVFVLNNLSYCQLYTHLSKYVESNNTSIKVLQIANDDNGNLYMLATRWGIFDAQLIKTNKEGEIIWDKKLGGANFYPSTYGKYHISVFNQSMYVICRDGYISNDSFILKFDLDGNHISTRRLYNTQDGNFVRIKASINYYYVGFDDGHQVTHYCFNMDDSLIWSCRINFQAGGNYLRDFTVTDNEEIIGIYQGNPTTYKIDNTGNVVWKRVFNCPAYTEVTSLEYLKDGTCLVVGSIANSGPTYVQTLFAMIDSSGYIVNPITIPDFECILYRSAKLKNGNFLISGWGSVDPNSYTYYFEVNHNLEILHGYRREFGIPNGHIKNFLQTNDNLVFILDSNIHITPSLFNSCDTIHEVSFTTSSVTSYATYPTSPILSYHQPDTILPVTSFAAVPSNLTHFYDCYNETEQPPGNILITYVYPTLFNDHIHVNSNTPIDLAYLTAMDGKMIQFNNIQGKLIFDIETQLLAHGVYTITLVAGDQAINQKLIKY